ncbi:glycosyltransferase family 4 protein [Cognatishimia maritima]|uniref:Glycosyltransferase involved in cell wall bisynthesis n=1 Tax=Cognatishimia maritima TaxID=870908 RepID=A0A1M5WD26_9RHOB|nr:glycosyltransferase family 4 protein [Cognatishimia maritima]SHH85425.1 Glycosyltransferase involved in cell wall bisynthesis [Cognatishimia maritima]
MEKRIALVSGTAWYLWNFRRNVIAALVSEGWQVTVIAGADEWTSHLAAMTGVQVLDWPVSLDGSNPIEEWAALRRVWRLLRRARPKVVFNNGIKANVYGGLACRLLRLPYVNNVSGLGMRMRKRDAMGRILTRLYSFASSRAETLLVQNPADLDFLRSHGLSKSTPVVRTMGSGVDLTQFQNAPLPPDLPRRFVFVGRLQTDKGIEDFVAVAQRARAAHLPAEFTVVGDTFHANAGAIRAATLKDWGRAQNIQFVGRQTDVRPYLTAAHVLVMPSHGGEGLPKVILEAAASGRPVIASDVDGCRDGLVEGQTGWLVPPRDLGALTETVGKICAMASSDLETMSAKARELAEQRFSDQLIAETCLRLAESSTSNTVSGTRNL